MITRFAPSPTGFLHLGNIRTALIAYYYVKSSSNKANNKSNNKFILRVDDTDTARVNEEYINQIFEDLTWLGIKYDETFKQSERFVRYREVLDDLLNKGRVYACYETQEELEFKRKSLLKRGLPPIYDRESLNNQDKIQNKIAGRTPYYRFKLDYDDIVSWNDKIRGKITINLQSTSDPIILRENGLYTYMLPSVIDDIDYNINAIVRGEDHITNTAVQIQMLKAIGANIPEFIHLPLLKAQDSKISKRSRGMFEIKSLRDDNIEPETIINYLLNLGNTKPFDFNNENILNNFNIENYSSSAVSLSIEDIIKLNGKFLYQSSFDDIKDRLPQEIDEKFWNVLKGNIDRISELDYWYKICKSDIKTEEQEQLTNEETSHNETSSKGIINKDILDILNKDIISYAISTFPYGESDSDGYKTWIESISKDMNCKKSEVSINLRLALTGTKKGPEIAKLLSLIDDPLIIERLKSSIK